MKADYHWTGEIYYIYNPNKLPEDSLPIIYGFNNSPSGDRYGLLCGVLLTEDGAYLGRHASSSEGWMLHDLLAIPVDKKPLTKAQKERRKSFENHYPKGYRLIFIKTSDVPEHKGLAEAHKKYQASIVKKAS